MMSDRPLSLVSLKDRTKNKNKTSLKGTIGTNFMLNTLQTPLQSGRGGMDGVRGATGRVAEPAGVVVIGSCEP